MTWPTADETDLATEVRRVLSRHADLAGVREGESHVEAWKHLTTGLGVVGLAVPADHGGAGADLGACAVVAEEIGRACAAVPYLSAALAADVLVRAGATELIGELVEGQLAASVGFPLRDGVLPGLRAVASAGGWALTGTVRAVLDGATADLVVLTAIAPDGERLFALPATAPGVTRRQLRTTDLGRPAAGLELTAAAAVLLPVRDVAGALAGVRRTAAVLIAAEQCGVSARALETAVEHAKVRRQFGKPIGSFQAVKHLLADLYAAAERARALVVAAVDLSRAFSGSAVDPGRASSGPAVDIAVEAALVGACEAANLITQGAVQVLGGIGFTWEHDAHLYFRRARANAALLGGTHRRKQALAELLLAGDGLAEPDPPATEEEAAFGARVREWLDANTTVKAPVRGGDAQTEARHVAAGKAYRAALGQAGLAGITVPKEYGGAGLSIVADGTFARAVRGRESFEDVFGIGTGMCVPVLLTLGTEAQKSRYVAPLLRGEEIWCQMFSEPEAGSDLASLRTRAVRQDDGTWLVSGQKVWTTYAHHADFSLLLARTDPDAPKHQGITMFVVDMRTPGVTARPLRQSTGDSEFNEVFLDDVRLPADAVLGEVNGGWHAATVMLMNERVTIGREPLSQSPPVNFAKLRELILDRALDTDTAAGARLADMFLLERGLQLLGHKVAAGLKVGTDPGPFASISKLGAAQLARLTTEIAYDLAGPQAGAWDADDAEAGVWSYSVLFGPARGIAGGTDQIQRTIIADRLLGLPKG
jgi:alkylation response protein AidB-like acyl-CoA dehydrogenase